MQSLAGKRGLVMGVANERSIAWGIAKALAEAGAELAFTYQGDAFGQRLAPLAASVGSDFMVDVDVTDDASLDAAFDQLAARWPTIDFVVHAIAYSDKNELTGRFVNTSRDNFKNSLDISAYSFIEVARRAHPMMEENGGTLITLTYQGSNKVTPFYNVMGVAKAALEATTRYLANDLGPDGIRVNAISPGPTLPNPRQAQAEFDKQAGLVPLGHGATPDDIVAAARYILSARAMTGQTLMQDGGQHLAWQTPDVTEVKE